MNMVEFIIERYPIKDKLIASQTDPIKQVMESDALPYDEIKMVDGQLQKVVEISDDNYMPVMELLSYTKEEVVKMEDSDFKLAYLAYMDNIDMEDASVESVFSAVREYSQNKAKKKELLENVQHS